MDSLKQRIFDIISEKHQDLVELSDYLADNPEVSKKEYNSVSKIGEILAKEGLEFISPYEGFPTGFFASRSKQERAHKVAILVEYDALPKLGHACGHNVSCCISLLAGLALSRVEDELDTSIHIIGTPAEETDGAKCKMEEDGIFKGYDMAMMIHLHNDTMLAPKIVCLSSYLYSFKGKAAHSSEAPWDGINALNGAQLFMHAVDMLRQHVTPDVQMHGVYRDGGTAPNIVPDSASIELYLRASTKSSLELVDKKVEACAKGAAMATGTELLMESTSSMYLDLRCSQSGIEALAEAYNEVGVEYSLENVAFGSSDIGNVSYSCPTFHPTLAIVPKGLPLHTVEFEQATRGRLAHDSIATGAKIIAVHTVNLMSDWALLSKIKNELDF